MRDIRTGIAGAKRKVAEHSRRYRVPLLEYEKGSHPIPKRKPVKRPKDSPPLLDFEKGGGGRPRPKKRKVLVRVSSKTTGNKPTSPKPGSLFGAINNRTVQRVIKTKANNTKPDKPKNNKPSKTGKGDRSLAGISTVPTGQLLDEGMADDGAKLYDPKTADTMADQEYDPQIKVLHNEQAQQVSNAAQAMHDIEKWYGQVSSSQATAADRNRDAGSRATTDMGTVGAAILSSLGGSANMGAGMVAGQAANDAGTQALMSQAENQYQNDLAPLLKMEQTGASNSERARQSQIAQGLVNQLLVMTGQKGAARTKNALQIKGLNNDILNHRLDTLMGIKTANNATSQQGFQNAMTLREQEIAAKIGNAQVAAYNQQSQGGSNFVPWARLDPSQKAALIKAAVGNKIDPTTGGLIGNPTNAWNLARQYLTGQGYSSAAKGRKGRSPTQISQMIDAALRNAIAINNRRQDVANQGG